VPGGRRRQLRRFASCCCCSRVAACRKRTPDRTGEPLPSSMIASRSSTEPLVRCAGPCAPFAPIRRRRARGRRSDRRTRHFESATGRRSRRRSSMPHDRDAGREVRMAAGCRRAPATAAGRLVDHGVQIVEQHDVGSEHGRCRRQLLLGEAQSVTGRRGDRCCFWSGHLHAPSCNEAAEALFARRLMRAGSTRSRTMTGRPLS